MTPFYEPMIRVPSSPAIVILIFPLATVKPARQIQLQDTNIGVPLSLASIQTAHHRGIRDDSEKVEQLFLFVYLVRNNIIGGVIPS